MKRELALHLVTGIVLFVLISLLKGYLSFSFWPFWVGALIGTVLPDIDHIIYVYYLRPYELTSQRVMYQAQKGNLVQSWNLLASTRNERTDLILHSFLFQIIFVILGFLVMTSNGKLLGRGIVVAFLLHLFVDEIWDLRANGNLANWLKNFPIELDKTQLNIYLVLNFVVIFVYGFLM